MTNTKRAATQKMALELMAEHGLIEKGWTFRFDRALRRHGNCNFTTKTISLSGEWVERKELEASRKTMLHEIAHALVGHHHGHNRIWAMKCREIGGDGQRLASSDGIKLANLWTGVCPQGHTTGQHRAPLRVKTCGRCSRWFNLEYIIAWSKAGNPVAHENVSKRYADEFRSLMAAEATSPSAAHA